MTAQRKAPVRGADRPGRPGRPDGAARTTTRRPPEAPPTRRVRRPQGVAPTSSREPRPRSGPQNGAPPRAAARPGPAKNTTQAKARAKARKAKAPKVVRTPLRERLITRLASVDLRPRTWAAKVPFVVLVIGSLGIGLGITLWLSTDAAERSYQLGNVREHNRVLLQQKEALERDVLAAQSAPALAEAARNLGMIPTRDTAHLVQDPGGNWVVVGSPKPAEGVPPPPLNTKLPEDRPAALPPVAPVEVPVRVAPGAGPAGPTGPRPPLLGMIEPGQQPLQVLAPGAPIPAAPPLPEAVPPAVTIEPPPAGPLPGPIGTQAPVAQPPVAQPPVAPVAQLPILPGPVVVPGTVG